MSHYLDVFVHDETDAETVVAAANTVFAVADDVLDADAIMSLVTALSTVKPVSCVHVLTDNFSIAMIPNIGMN